MSESFTTPDDNLDNIVSLKERLIAKINELPDGTVLHHNARQLKITNSPGIISIAEHFNDDKLGGSICTIKPDGTISSYRIMPQDIGKSQGSFPVTEDLYTSLLEGLENGE